MPLASAGLVETQNVPSRPGGGVLVSSVFCFFLAKGLGLQRQTSDAALYHSAEATKITTML